MMTLKVISRLLEYPSEALWLHRDELIEALEQADELPVTRAVQLMVFVREYLNEDLLDMQAQYCELFDRGRATSLLLFEHVHGESRDRGQAMVDLMAQYQQHGLQIDCRELPDHLPIYLEYLTVLTTNETIEGLQDIAPILALLGERLKQRESRFSVLFDFLLELSHSDIAAEQLSKQVATEVRDDTPEALDAVWEEEQVKFFADEKTCGSEVAAHQHRFANAVVPQYLDLSVGSSHVGVQK
ncbi:MULTISPECIES: nitrate reductase molybdenum cofactor assembly chaperone [Providencia]|uniref:Nitrate reductase molybdenum cofactor assembly chaperone NarJ n=1 Tax=Providencia rettgeri TaxID=587 RepID=A0A379FWN4_PRORE|nr:MULTISPECIES: nitrate reductase molybdenum cofactor assembly chaperone [Providencia]EJD6376387.1 nitrate reductase molybdenum cofactor assembly chaperone [Providencia rettgeri]ELR5117927.1 nitrate reductase molybdenum cofactor assembly chaperone [Providencia rettgeri]MBI6202490.1 nitrate reductase molybdenum cofactor assembly chaperone [Providencia rettgeri]MCG5281137.1 nitrate reductase molybdenum cofactor assembly chaperone [Providencia rettgeri]MCX9108977.1 nitrate reductase molybdenum c